MDAEPSAGIAFESAAGRWLLATAVAGSGMAFLDSTVVNGVADVQFATWIEDTSLNENQVRIMVLLSREQSGTSATGGKVQRRVEIIASMRSINQDS